MHIDKDNSQKELYFVAVKLFLEHDGKLLILKDKFGNWDLPGGRVKKNEFDTELGQIVLRKLSEELGSDVKIQFSVPTVFMRHKRNEAFGDSREAKIFGLGYVATFMSGEIKLSPAHIEMKWVNIKTFKPEEYFTGGWLKGVQDYLKSRF